MQTLAVIIGNRDFFPDHLVLEARKELSALLAKLDVRAVMLSETDTKNGGVETYNDARRCADLFRNHREEIDGILVVLPNFGDEKGVADTIRLSGLTCPVLVQAYPDALDKLNPSDRRDSYCGKISVCNNLTQYGIPFTLTGKHVVAISDPSFHSDLRAFLATCRVVRSVRGARLGAIGARPTAFNTVRYSEKILERNGVSVTTFDLSELFAAMESLSDGDARVKDETDRIHSYATVQVKDDTRMKTVSKLGVVLRDWIRDNAIDAIGFQCWTSIQKNIGINPCTVMSMLSEEMVPSACEVDITGVLTMLAMQEAAGSPAGLVDWNNNYADDPDKCVLFHCGNWAKSLMGGKATICTAPILGTTVGEPNTFGALAGRSPGGSLTFGRLTTDDLTGSIRAYVGEGEFTDDELKTFGTRAVVRVPDLNGLMHYVCREGFEHHTVMTRSETAGILEEAFTRYLGWETYHHGR